MVEVPLSQGMVALIDDEDAAHILPYKWSLWTKKSRGESVCYACRYVSRANGKRSSIKMHRFILDAPSGIEVDHRNGDGLDNRKSNLRFATRAQNGQNIRKHKPSRCGYKGVYFHKKNRLYHATITYERKKISLGYYRSAEEAARAYDAAAKHYHGEFAALNFQEVK